MTATEIRELIQLHVSKEEIMRTEAGRTELFDAGDQDRIDELEMMLKVYEAKRTLGDPMFIHPAFEKRGGERIKELLGLRKVKGSDRFQTDWGTKTELGLFRTIARIVEEQLKASDDYLANGGS